MTPNCRLYMLTHTQDRSQDHNRARAEYSYPSDRSQQPASHTHSSDPCTGTTSMPIGGYRLPVALLAQYPALSGIWENLPSNGSSESEENISVRNSFDSGDSGSETQNKAPEPSEPLSAEAKVHLLEKILRAKGILAARIIERSLLTFLTRL
jgi:hypothetical protein